MKKLIIAMALIVSLPSFSEAAPKKKKSSKPVTSRSYAYDYNAHEDRVREIMREWKPVSPTARDYKRVEYVNSRGKRVVRYELEDYSYLLGEWGYYDDNGEPWAR